MAKRQQPEAVWGLEIGGSAARLVRVAREGEGDAATYRLERYKQVELTRRWTQSPDWPALLEELGARRVSEPLVVCLPDEQVLYRRLELPAGDDATLAQLVEAQAEGQLPLARDALALGWDRAGQATEAGMQPVLLCAARQEHADRIVSALGAVGRGVTLVPSGMAVAAGWMRFGNPGDEPCIIVDVAAQHTSVVLIDGGQVVHVSTLDEGGDHWTEAIADDLELPLHEAEALKRALTEDDGAGGDGSGADRVQRQRAAASLARAQDGWEYRLEEVYRTCIAALPGARSDPGSGAPPESHRPQRVVLLGGGANLPGVAERVAQRLGVAPQAPEPADGAAQHAADMDWPAVLTAAGGALHAMATLRPAVRLHRPVVEAPRAQWRVPIKAAAAAVWLLAMVAGLYAFDLHRANRLEAQVQDLQRSAAESAQLEHELRLGRYLEQGPVPPIVVLETLSSVVPKETVLSGWDYSREATTRIRGKIKGVGPFAALWRDLADSPHLEHVTMRNLNVAGGGGSNREWEFEIDAELAPLFRYDPARDAAAAQAEGDPADNESSEGGGAAPADRRRAARAQEQGA